MVAGLYPPARSLCRHGTRPSAARSEPRRLRVRSGIAPRLTDAYRRSGAELPFGDPGRAHGTALEGYYWRLVEPGGGRVVVALCGVCRAPGGNWAVVALAGHPGGFVRHACVEEPRSAVGEFGVTAGDLLRGSADGLCVRLADDAWLDVRLSPRVGRPGRAFGALGPAQVLPRLTQYWHPVALSAQATGRARLGDAEFQVDASAYAEKNWGAAFPPRWWWGQAGDLADGGAGVAFAGGPLATASGRLAATAVVLLLGDEPVRLVAPLALVRADVGDGAWRIRARSARYAVELEGEAGGADPHVLPVPDVRSGRVEMRSAHHLAGRLAVRVRRGRSVLLAEESQLAGLEDGLRAEIGAARERGRPRPREPHR